MSDYNYAPPQTQMPAYNGGPYNSYGIQGLYTTQIPQMYQQGMLQRQPNDWMSFYGPLAASAASGVGSYLGRPKNMMQTPGGISPVSVGQSGGISPEVLLSLYASKQPQRFRSLLGQYLRG